MAKEGDVRIAKTDTRNYSVQQYRKIVSNKDKTERLEWADVGYYGDKLEWAARSALMQSVPESQSLIGEFHKAADRIIAAIRQPEGALF